MKQQLFTIVGALVVLLLIVVWAYLFFFGTPEKVDEVFSEFGSSGEVDDTFIVSPVVEELPLVEVEKQQLRQLTTRPVAGFREILDDNNTPYLYYVEMGTGHIYAINMLSSEEKRRSGVTVSKAYQAEISTAGDFFAIASLNNSKNMPLVLGQLATNTDELVLSDFNKSVRDFSISETNELLYAEPTNQGLNGYSYNLKTKLNSKVFSLPFHEAEIQWSNEGASSSQYIYPKPSYALKGFLYEVKANQMFRLPIEGYGFSARANDDLIIYTTSVNQIPTTHLYNRSSGITRVLDTYVLPEKCTIPVTGIEVLCAQEAIDMPYETPDTWYQGNLSFKDTIYLLEAESFTAKLIVDTLAASSREIDVVGMQLGESRSSIYFINKNNNTLWVYEL